MQLFSGRYDLLKSYLHGRTQCVQIEGIISEYAKLVCGVPQGSVLGLLNFCFYMYPLGSILRHHCINYHIYADDTQLYITFDLSDPSIAIEKLNLCISDIRTWMVKNKLKINDSKVVARAPEVDKNSYQALYQAHYTRPSGPAYLQPIVKCPLKRSYQ